MVEYFLFQAMLECEGDPNCNMFVDHLGSGVKFKMCPTGSSRIRSLKGSTLYIKGNIEKYVIHKTLSKMLILPQSYGYQNGMIVILFQDDILSLTLF